jgi:large subunit ribosomal protein L18
MSTRNRIKDTYRRRLRRKLHIRRRVFGSPARPRLTVSRSLKNISCQLIDDQRGVTLAAASTLEKSLRERLGEHRGNRAAAAQVGKVIAERVLSLGIQQVQFDRNGYRFHGRVKALVDAAREGGLKI